jgi:hypothetical protein
LSSLAFSSAEIIFVETIQIVGIVHALAVERLAFGRLFGDTGIGHRPRVPWLSRARTEDRRELAGELHPIPPLRREAEASAAPTPRVEILDQMVSFHRVKVEEPARP